LSLVACHKITMLPDTTSTQNAATGPSRRVGAEHHSTPDCTAESAENAEKGNGFVFSTKQKAETSAAPSAPSAVKSSPLSETADCTAENAENAEKGNGFVFSRNRRQKRPRGCGAPTLRLQNRRQFLCALCALRGEILSVVRNGYASATGRPD